MRNLIITLFVGLFMACSCAHVAANDGSDVRRLGESTVFVRQHLTGDIIHAQLDGGILIQNGESAGAVGTGVVVEVEGGESLVITVAHVAHKKDIIVDTDSEDPSLFRVDTSSLTVRTLEGTECPAEEIYYNEIEDLSILRIACIAGVPLPLAGGLPPIGSEVLVTGAALSIHPDGIFIPVDGRYVGVLDVGSISDKHAMTNPIAPGHSGSPVTYDGKLIGVARSHRLDWEHLSFFVPIDVIRSGISSVRKTWHAH